MCFDVALKHGPRYFKAAVAAGIYAYIARTAQFPIHDGLPPFVFRDARSNSAPTVEHSPFRADPPADTAVHTAQRVNMVHGLQLAPYRENRAILLA